MGSGVPSRLQWMAVAGPNRSSSQRRMSLGLEHPLSHSWDIGRSREETLAVRRQRTVKEIG